MECLFRVNGHIPCECAPRVWEMCAGYGPFAAYAIKYSKTSQRYNVKIWYAPKVVISY